MVRKQKKLKNLLRKQEQQSKVKSIHVRETKYDTIKKMNGWRKKDSNWEHRVSENIDKLVNEIKKGYNLTEEDTSVLTGNIMKRVKIYQEIAVLTGVSLTRGEVMWAVQYEFIYQRNLYKQDTTTEEARRDVNVHNLKYLIEQTYSRNNNPNFEGLKQQIYDHTELNRIPATNNKTELQEVYTNLLIQAVNETKEFFDKE